MLKRMSHMVHGIERFLDLLPEPLVLRAMADPAEGRTPTPTHGLAD